MDRGACWATVPGVKKESGWTEEWLGESRVLGFLFLLNLFMYVIVLGLSRL